METTRELTGDEIVEAALCSERKLTDEGKPGQQPSTELLGEDRPIEGFLAGATMLEACRIVQTNHILGIIHGFAVVTNPALGDAEGFVILQACVKAFRGDSGDEEEEKDSEVYCSALPFHNLGIDGGDEGGKEREEGRSSGGGTRVL